MLMSNWINVVLLAIILLGLGQVYKELKKPTECFMAPATLHTAQGPIKGMGVQCAKVDS